MRDELKRLWFYRRPGWAKQAWGRWLEQAQGCGIAALALFAQRLRPYLRDPVSLPTPAQHSSIVEDINNTIKVIKRRAYGYRDQEDFFLNIRAAFLGIPR